MTWMTRPTRSTRSAASLFLLLLAGGLVGCGDPLEVSDPTRVQESDVSTAEGAELLRRAVLRELYRVVGEAAWHSGLLADEFRAEPPSFYEQFGIANPDDLLDRRATVEYEEQQLYVGSSYVSWQELWGREATVATAKLESYAPPGAREAQVGEMYAARGYAALRLAEDFCPGFPLHDVVDYRMVYRPPLSTEQAFERALTVFDTALTRAADSARVLNLARVGRGRVLLNLGRFAEAAAAVADVPDDYVYQTEHNSTFDPFQPNQLANGPWGVERSLADREGGNGLDFVSAADPRVPADSFGVALDGSTVMYGLPSYRDIGTPFVVASGTEARLIEAEAALQANDPTTWLATLNQLRQTAGLADTTDPGTSEARVDLMFRERAFWLFGTGHRLGDLRRLIRQYNRTPESVFPTGNYWRGGVYGTGTSIPMHRDEVQYSPGVTGCTSW